MILMILGLKVGDCPFPRSRVDIFYLESANMLIMTLAYSQRSGNGTFISQYVSLEPVILYQFLIAPFFAVHNAQGVGCIPGAEHLGSKSVCCLRHLSKWLY